MVLSVKGKGDRRHIGKTCFNQRANIMAGWQACRLAGLAVATGKARNGTLLNFSLCPVIHTNYDNNTSATFVIESCTDTYG